VSIIGAWAFAWFVLLGQRQLISGLVVGAFVLAGLGLFTFVVVLICSYCKSKKSRPGHGGAS